MRWGERTGERMIEISETAEWITSNAHNGYLDLALDLGLIGLVLFLAILTTGLRRSLVLFKSSRANEYSFSLSLIIFWGIISMFGSRIGSVHLSTFLMFVVLIKLAHKSQNSCQESQFKKI